MPPSKRSYTRRQSLTKGQEKQVKDIAQKAINTEVENKEAIFERVERKPGAAINTGDLTILPATLVPNGSQSNYYDLLPGISQSGAGTAGRKYNTRIGNEITLKSIHLKGFLEYDQDFATEVLGKNKKLAVRLMVLSQKRSGNFTNAYTNMSTRLLRTATNADENTGPYTGAAINSCQDINRDVYTVHHDQTLYMTAPVLNPGSAAGAQVDVATNPSTLKFINKKFYFGGKKGMKLRFANSTATVPENFAPFIVIGYSSYSNNQVPSDGLIRFTYNCSASYQDA